MYPITKPQTTWQLCKIITRLWISNVHFMSGALLIEILETIGALMGGRFFMSYVLSDEITLAIVISYWMIVLCMVAGVMQIQAYYKNVILHRLTAVTDNKITFGQIMNVEVAHYTKQRIFWGLLIIAWVPYIISFAMYNISMHWDTDDNIALYAFLTVLLSFVGLYFYVRFYVWAAVIVEEDETVFNAFKISYRLTRGSFWRLAFTLLIPYILMIIVAIIAGSMEVGYIGAIITLLIMLAISSWYYPAQVLILTDLYLREEAKGMKKRKPFDGL